MFEWLFPAKCPCNPPAKEWIEYRLQWLCDEFDDHAFNGRRIVLPTPQFIPAKYDESYDSVRDLLDQVCEYMDVDPQFVRLQIFDDLQRVSPLVNEHGQSLTEAGTYEEGRRQTIIRIARSGLHDPMKLVGTLAHELAHKRLLGESRIMNEEFDNELLTDLTTVVFGLGVFQANSDRPLIRSQETWEGTKYTRPEYMTPPMYGYALAHLAWFRGEVKPAWGEHSARGIIAILRSGERAFVIEGGHTGSGARAVIIEGGRGGERSIIIEGVRSPGANRSIIIEGGRGGSTRGFVIEGGRGASDNAIIIEGGLDWLTSLESGTLQVVG